MALHRLDVRGVLGGDRALRAALPRRFDEQDRSAELVASLIAEVRAGGDEALRRLTDRFDAVVLDDLRVSEAEVRSARERVSGPLLGALVTAHRRIEAYHSYEARSALNGSEPYRSQGVTVHALVRPVARAGCYAPGGRARYPSTVLMCAVPARVAGVQEVVLCVPPGPDGRIDDATLAAAWVAGIDTVYRVGGAQAIAAMAYGTETIEPVEVIVGPGNRYVGVAKRLVSGVVGVASAFAGPSEVVVVAGPDTPPPLAAIDLVVQAEHGPDGLAWLVTWSETVVEAVGKEIERLVATSPRRADLEATLGAGGYAVVVEGPEQAMAVANVVAPEHLELLVDDAEALLPLVHSAGAVFLGAGSPASIGDYLAGPNHVLPTNRSARFASALRVDDFLRHIHAVRVEPEGLEALGPDVLTLAETEGLPAHAESVRRRLVR
ncbi:MAG: histidinol dehydrogenase [Acidimicrobiales bacterium]